MGAVERCPLDADAMQRRLDDGVLLRVHRPAKLMAGAGGYAIARAAYNVAVLQAGWRAIVACGERMRLFSQRARPLGFEGRWSAWPQLRRSP